MPFCFLNTQLTQQSYGACAVSEGETSQSKCARALHVCGDRQIQLEEVVPPGSSRFANPLLDEADVFEWEFIKSRVRALPLYDWSTDSLRCLEPALF